MSAAGKASDEGRLRLPDFAKGTVASRFSEWRWRLAGIFLLCLYLLQDFLGLHWEWLKQLQTIDMYKYATGSCLMVYVAWQWYLFWARLQGTTGQNLLAFHQRTGALAPVLFYTHTVQLGYGYLAVLSWIFLGNLLIGMMNPIGIRIRSRSYIACWGAVHVTLAVLTAALGGYHAYIAVYYK